jgi:hypothetical protein
MTEPIKRPKGFCDSHCGKPATRWFGIGMTTVALCDDGECYDRHQRAWDAAPVEAYARLAVERATAELRAEVERLRAELSATTERLENRAGTVQALCAETVRLEAERDEARAERDALVDATGSGMVLEAIQIIRSDKAEVESLRAAAQGVLDAMEVVRIAKQSEGAGGGSWISRPATREHQVRMQKAYADMHKAEAALRNTLKEPK